MHPAQHLILDLHQVARIEEVPARGEEGLRHRLRMRVEGVGGVQGDLLLVWTGGLRHNPLPSPATNVKIIMHTQWAAVKHCPLAHGQRAPETSAPTALRRKRFSLLLWAARATASRALHTSAPPAPD